MVPTQCGSSEVNAMQWFKDLVELISNKPWVIFVVFTLAFGYVVYDQNTQIHEMGVEVGGLRAEMKNMNEIIKLKVALAEKECPIIE